LDAEGLVMAVVPGVFAPACSAHPDVKAKTNEIAINRPCFNLYSPGSRYLISLQDKPQCSSAWMKRNTREFINIRIL
jgi:hypothetical protein